MNAYPELPSATHEVFNQAPPLGDVNLYAIDAALRDAVRREGAGASDAWLLRTRRRARDGDDDGACRRCESPRADAEGVRRHGPAQRHRRVPPRLPRADDVPEAPRHRRGAVGGTRRRRARPARRALHPVRAGRGRHAVPGHDDLCERPRAAARSGARGTLAAAGGGARLRSALRAGVRQARRHDRHGHDREAGRLRRADQHDAGGAAPAGARTASSATSGSSPRRCAMRT